MRFDYSAIRKDNENVHFVIDLNDEAAKNVSSKIENDLLIQKVIIDAFKHLKNVSDTEIAIEITEMSGRDVSYMIINGEEEHPVHHLALKTLSKNKVLKKIQKKEIVHVDSDYFLRREINRAKIEKLLQKFKEDIDSLQDQMEKKMSNEVDLILIKELKISNQIQTIENDPVNSSESNKKISALIDDHILKHPPSDRKVLQNQKKNISGSSRYIEDYLNRELEGKLNEVRNLAKELFIENDVPQSLQNVFVGKLNDLITDANNTFVDQNNLGDVLRMQLRNRISPEGISTNQYGLSRIRNNFRNLIKNVVTGIMHLYVNHLSRESASRIKLDFTLSPVKLLESAKEKVEKDAEIILEKLKFPLFADYIDMSQFTKKKLAHDVFEQVVESLRQKEYAKKITDLESRWKIDEALNFFNNIKDESDVLDHGSPYRLLDIPALDMPLDALLKIPVTEKNKAILTRIWSKQLHELYLTGDLYCVSPYFPSKRLEQKLIYAEKYLATKAAIPKEIIRDLEMFHKVEVGVKEQDIRDFLIANLPGVDPYAAPLFPGNSLLGMYQKVLIPLMDQYINAVISEHKGAMSLKEYLSDEIHPFIVSVAQLVLDRAQGLYSPDEAANITNEKLQHEILCRFRRAAIEAFSISMEAWDHLRGIQQAEQLMRFDNIQFRKVWTSDLVIRIDKAPRIVVRQALDNIQREISKIEKDIKEYQQTKVEKIKKKYHKIEKLNEKKLLLENVLNNWEDRKKLAGDKKLVLPGSVKDISELTVAEISNEISYYEYDKEKKLISLISKLSQLRRSKDYSPSHFKVIMKGLQKFQPTKAKDLTESLIETTKLQSERDKILGILNNKKMASEDTLEIESVTFRIADINDVSFVTQIIDQNNQRIKQLRSVFPKLDSFDEVIANIKESNEFLQKISKNWKKRIKICREEEKWDIKTPPLMIKSGELSAYETKILTKKAIETEFKILDQRDQTRVIIDGILLSLSSGIIIKRIEKLRSVSIPEGISLKLADCSVAMLKQIKKTLEGREKHLNNERFALGKDLAKFYEKGKVLTQSEIEILENKRKDIKSEIKRISSEIKSSKSDLNELEERKLKMEKKKKKASKIEIVAREISEVKQKIKSLKTLKKNISVESNIQKNEIKDYIEKNKELEEINSKIESKQKKITETQNRLAKIQEMFSDWDNRQKIAGDVEVKSFKASFDVAQLNGTEMEKLNESKSERVALFKEYYVDLPEQQHVWIFDVTAKQMERLANQINGLKEQSKKSLSSAESLDLKKKIDTFVDVLRKITVVKEGRLVEGELDARRLLTEDELVNMSKGSEMPEIDAAIDSGTLQTLEVTSENSQQVMDKLKYVATELFRKGSLKDIVDRQAGYELDLAAPYAKKYLEVRDIIIGFKGFSQEQKDALLNHLVTIEGSVEVKDLRKVSHRVVQSLGMDRITLIPGISREEMRSLRLISLCLDKINNKQKVNLNRAQKQELANFLQNAKGNNQLNKILSKSIEVQRVPDGISIKALEFLRTFTYKSKYIDQFQKVTAKLENSWTKVISGQKLAPEERLTVSELGVLRQLINHSSDFSKLKQMGLTSREAGFGGDLAIQIESLEALVNIVEHILGDIQTAIEKEELYKPGDILLEKVTGHLAYLGAKQNRIAFLQRYLITQYQHEGTIIPFDKFSNKLNISEVTASWGVNELPFATLAFSDVYRINPTKLISDESSAILKQIYFDKYDKEISGLFQQIERELHETKESTEKFKNIKNSKERRMNAGKAKYQFWKNLRRKPSDFGKLHDKFYGEKISIGETMICSEFASKTNIAALMELDKRLRVKIVKELEDTNQRDLAEKYRSGELKVIDLSLYSHGKLKHLYPGKFVQLLASRKAVEKVEPPMVLQNLMK